MVAPHVKCTVQNVCSLFRMCSLALGKGGRGADAEKRRETGWKRGGRGRAGEGGRLERGEEGWGQREKRAGLRKSYTLDDLDR